MESSPDLLNGLLDDNLTAFLDEMISHDGQGSVAQLPSTSNNLAFCDFMPVYNAPTAVHPHSNIPIIDPGNECEDHSNDTPGSRKRSGSGGEARHLKASFLLAK